ncbi:hypothetical protein BJ878DRAFT_541111 [Calycina marina]|uniref:Uncharacterized protein n=1 Tax=Calycina marina TaxID=1763456 RepID=A0A9P8CFW7_9HELO|nr:hypothetical protein BJ878DRAFT_541111 [Calycina marina]
MLASNSKKHAREEDEDYGSSGFSGHRTAKRHIVSLPHRISPNLTRNESPFSRDTFTTNYTIQTPPPQPPTITPVDSDCEEARAILGPKTIFSPYSSLPTNSIPPTSPRLDSMNSSQSTQLSDISGYTDDCEMEDTVHLSPGPFHSNVSTTLTGRIPTPIHSQFSASIRAEKPTRPRFLARDGTMEDRFMRNCRLPSPISEGEPSPATITGFKEMSMDVDHVEETPTKKGHHRSKHSLRQWNSYSGLESNGPATPGIKRNFTIGYRADCEKCRIKVPGHNAHIITY